MSLIYKTTNLINNKIYIGQTNYKRKNYKGSGSLIKLVFKKYKKRNFKFEIIVNNIFNKFLLDELEKHYIRLYNLTNSNIGYNICDGGTSEKYINITPNKNKINVNQIEKGKRNKNIKI